MWLGKVIRSFRYALEGLRYTLVTQRNMRVHFLSALGVLLLSLYLPLSKAEALLLFVTIILVLVAELFNTAVESVVDMITEEFHPLAKVAKDVAAGAVLLCAGLAVVVGVSVFWPYLDKLFSAYFKGSHYPLNISLAAIIAFDFFLTLMIKGWMHRLDRARWEPSITTSLAFCIATSLVLIIGQLLVTILVYLMALLLTGTRYRMHDRAEPVILGALLGIVVAVFGVHLL
ncbi:diacylglycerol kinase [Polycladomyces subterraneus]|uniref:Diacylglycerol kinase n=1 Tax=Polycladomyces subterraneus TaxID=1016997 RepID=A0ABT8IPY0_9BACL|nr:diacylglycerol kinase [Polycladomyces subterraneus]MDN4594805.1 diacylglycerol kinase [Polycladomyces subterraneus]